MAKLGLASHVKVPTREKMEHRKLAR